MNHLDRWAKSTRKPRKPKKPGTVLEKDIQKAGIQAFAAIHRIQLKPMDAGGQGVKGLVAVFPQWLGEGLGLPKSLPFGLEAWIHVPPDFPDTLGRLKDGRWVVIEWKRPGEKPRPGQAAYLEAFRAQGHIAFWADSVESALSQFEQQLKQGEAA